MTNGELKALVYAAAPGAGLPSDFRCEVVAGGFDDADATLMTTPMTEQQKAAVRRAIHDSLPVGLHVIIIEDMLKPKGPSA